MGNNNTFGRDSEVYEEKHLTIRGSGIYSELLRVRKGRSSIVEPDTASMVADERTIASKRYSRRYSNSSTGSSTLYEKESIASECDWDEKHISLDFSQTDGVNSYYGGKSHSNRSSRDGKPKKTKSFFGRGSIFPSEPFRLFRQSITWPQFGELSASKFWNTKRRSECSTRSSRSNSWFKSRSSQQPTGLFGFTWREVLPYAGAMVKFQDKVIDLPVIVLKCGGCILDRRSLLINSLASSLPRSRRSSTSSFEEKQGTNIASIRRILCNGKDSELQALRAIFEDQTQAYGRDVDVSERDPVEMACLLLEYIFELPTASFKSLESGFQLASDVLQFSSDEVFGNVLVSILSYDDLMWFALSVIQTLAGSKTHEAIVEAFSMSVSRHIQQLRNVPDDSKDDYFEETAVRRALTTYLLSHNNVPAMI